MRLAFLALVHSLSGNYFLFLTNNNTIESRGLLNLSASSLEREAIRDARSCRGSPIVNSPPVRLNHNNFLAVSTMSPCTSCTVRDSRDPSAYTVKQEIAARRLYDRRAISDVSGLVLVMQRTNAACCRPRRHGMNDRKAARAVLGLRTNTSRRLV